MKKALAIAYMLMSSVFGASGPFNTWHGYLAGEDTVADRTTMIGAGAGGYGSKYVRSCFFGAGAGANGKNLTGCVGIGFGALANKTNLINATMINGHFYADGNTFWLKANNNGSDDLAPITYSGGTLVLNAERIITPSGTIGGGDYGAGKYDGYDMFMSTTGDDGNDGLTMATPKRTFDGCFASATNSAIVCVMPGTYEPPSNEPCAENGNMCFIVKSHSLEFRAIEGPSQTVIEGVYANTNGYADGYCHTMAFDGHLQTFDGFTIRNIGSFSDTASYGSKSKSSPAFSVCSLNNCVVENCTIPVNAMYCAFNTLFASNTVMRSIRLIFDYAQGSSIPVAMSSSSLIECQLYDISIPPAKYGSRLFSQNTFLDSLVILPDTFPNEKGGNSTAVNSTFIWPNSTPNRVSLAKSENCYFCIGEGFTSADGTRNEFAPSWTNTYLDASSYVPSSLDCPAVRNDETRDAGWKDSGLSKLKKLYLPTERYIIDALTGSNYVIRVENGELKVRLLTSKP